jgi:hypothetical protein
MMGDTTSSLGPSAEGHLYISMGGAIYSLTPCIPQHFGHRVGADLCVCSRNADVGEHAGLPLRQGGA